MSADLTQEMDRLAAVAHDLSRRLTMASTQAGKKTIYAPDGKTVLEVDYLAADGKTVLEALAEVDFATLGEERG